LLDIKLQNNSYQKLAGIGVGLRPCHYAYILEHQPPVAWFEILTDNYLDVNSEPLAILDQIAETYPLTLHGVGMSLGATDPLNKKYLAKLKILAQRTDAILISDHLSWTSHANQYFHELLPLPYTQEAIKHLVQRISAVQDFLGQRIMIENVSSYLTYSHSTIPEWEFLQAIADQADCLILLDLNNIYVSACNHQFTATDYLNSLTSQRIAQFHLAGFTEQGTHLLDTHGHPIQPPVWELYEKALAKFGPVPTMGY
jgi:uncharacterized protein (UPF0276 family)